MTRSHVFFTLEAEKKTLSNISVRFSPPVQAIAEALGLGHPTEVQRKGMPIIYRGSHVLLISPTGTGKTEAALLPLIDQLAKIPLNKRQGIQLLYITPLRALNRDIFRRLISFADTIGLTIKIRHGDTSPYARRKQAIQPPDILITTPETLQAILPASRMKQHLRNVKYVIVDELHELVASKRGSQLAVSLERLAVLTGKPFQRIGLSATIGDPLAVSKFLVGPHGQVHIVQVTPSKSMNIIVEHPIPTEKDEMEAKNLRWRPQTVSLVRKLGELITNHRSTLIFTNTRQTAEVLSLRLAMLFPDLYIAVHHGSLSKQVRMDAEEALKAGELRGVICTSSLELGIDIGQIDLVVQIGSPRQVSKLIQRVGRSGHQIQRVSKGIILSSSFDDILEAGVIVKKAEEQKIERLKPVKTPLDVLALCLAGMALDKETVSFDYAYSLLKKSWPFQKLTYAQLIEVITFLEKLYLLRPIEGGYQRTRKTRLYYYQNLSVIPDTRRYKIVNIVTNRIIGTLDEAYVVRRGREGEEFIIRGKVWRIVNTDDEEEKVTVEPVQNPDANAPNWVGAMIPVPYEIAQKVGELRTRIAANINNNSRLKRLLSMFALTGDAATLASSTIKLHVSEKLPIPDHKTIVIEQVEDTPYIVIHSCFGNKANETLGRLIAGLLTTRFGYSIAVRSAAYVILLQYPLNLVISPEKIAETIHEIDPYYIQPLLTRLIYNTTLFRWHFVTVGKRFGVIERKVNYDKINVPLLIQSMKDTPLVTETLNEIENKKFDISTAQKIVNAIKQEKIKLRFIYRRPKQGFSPIARENIQWFTIGDLVMPTQPEGLILETVKQRLLKKRVRLICVWCTKWETIRTIKTLDEYPTCPICHSRYITSTFASDTELRVILAKAKAKKQLSQEEKTRLRKAKEVATLVLSMGKRAIIAHAGRGIGAKTIKRILKSPYPDEDAFYKAILEAERNYVRTRAFWS
ncbi:MAG: DEAD/DEAH box helicase [Candidatus Ranarchaeia archaeon]